MKPRMLTLGLLLAINIALADAPDAPATRPATQPTTAPWGPVTSGFRVQLTTDKTQYKPMELIAYHLQLQNAGSTDQEVPWAFFEYGNASFRIISPLGQICPRTLFGMLYHLDGELSTRMLKPGDVIRARGLELNRDFDMTLPGKYILTATWHTALINHNPMIRLDVPSNQVVITIGG